MRNLRLAHSTTLGACFCLSYGPIVRAQEIVAPTPTVTRHLLEEEPPSGSLRLGIFDFYPRASSLTLYDDNISASSLVKKSDWIWSIAPGAAIALGEMASTLEKSLLLDYSPSFVFFTDRSQYDTVDHAARFSGIWPFSKLTLGFSQDFAQASSVVLGIADRVEHRSFNTLLTSHYELSAKTSFDVNGRQSITDYEKGGFNSSRERVIDDWVNSQWSEKLQLAAGASIGCLEADQNPNQLYQRVSLRSGYTLTGKVDVSASVGGERRSYSGTSSADYYPVFSLGGAYRPTPLMTISISGSRQEQSSAYLPGQNYISTSFSATVQEVIRERFLPSLSGSYNTMQYHANSSGLASTFSNDMFSIRPAFDWLIRRNWRTGIFYVYRQNSSEQRSYEYSNNQVGWQVSWSY